MRNSTLATLVAFITASFLLSTLGAWAQDAVGGAAEINANADGTELIVGQAFFAVKYARRVRVLSDGKQQFIRNERYPTPIARDAQGRLMMQHMGDFGGDLLPECDQPAVLVPPPCPSFVSFVIDPLAHTVAHWTLGERGAHVAIDMPLSQENQKRAFSATAEMPEVTPQIESDASSVHTLDLGERVIDGISAHGVRTTVVYPVGHSGNKTRITRIHEVWTAPEMRLIVRVVDGDPHGFETVWGLEKITRQPDQSLFEAPEGYEMQHPNSDSDKYLIDDFEHLKSWFAK